MLFSLLANICPISTLDLELFFNYSGYPPSLGVVTVGNRPIPLPFRTFVRIGIFPFPCLSATVRIASHHCRLPNPVTVPIIPPPPSPLLMMSRLFPLLLGRFPSSFLLNILYSGVLCRLSSQLYGSLP